MLKKIVIAVFAPVLIASGLMASPMRAYAIEAKGKCYVRLANGNLRGPTTLNIGACAYLAGQQIDEANDGIGRGKWNTLEIEAKADGTYQTLQDGVATASETRFWNVEALVDYMVDDIDQFWQRTFDEAGWDYTAPKRVQAYSGRLRTACGRVPSYNALYCRNANSIYYDVRLLQTQFGNIGDYAPATIIAHEWGHAIQAQRGLFRQTRSTASLEQQADCFAGAYTRDAAARGVLEESDVQEGTDLFGKLGSSRSHGSAKQRTAAFRAGLKDGVEACWSYVKAA